jgi:hypothetical protein
LESPTKEENISDACQKLTQGLATLAVDDLDPFSNAPFGNTATAQVHVPSHAQPTNINVSSSSNPWQGPALSPDSVPEADKWLHSVASSVGPSHNSAAIPVFRGNVTFPVDRTASNSNLYHRPAVVSVFSQYFIAAVGKSSA